MKFWEGLKCPRCGSEEVTPHMTPNPTPDEAEVWAPVRDEAFRCKQCGLTEECMNNAGDNYEAFRARWNYPIERTSVAERSAWRAERLAQEEEDARAWTWPDEDRPGDRAWRDARLRERREEPSLGHSWVENNEVKFEELKAIPLNTKLLGRILGTPDDGSSRSDYAAWLRTVPHPLASDAARFIETQLRLAESFAKNPRADIKDQLDSDVLSPREQTKQHLPDQDWWRCPRDLDLIAAMPDMTAILLEVGLTDNELYFRGFVEHVAIKAARFLEIADELYSLAPIRQLTITYCKGTSHKDPGLLRALLESPHLDRIRALKLPVRKFGWDKGDVTELNRLTDEDVELIAASGHLQGLRHLDLEDQKRLTVKAFDALAASTNLPELSAVRHDINRYWYPGTFSFGTSGKQERQVVARPLHDYASEIEARHGRIPWLHVAENYGSETPDVEAVIEHPVARRTGT